MQINATLVKGKARVQFGANKVSRNVCDTISAAKAAPSEHHYVELMFTLRLSTGA